MKSHYQRILTIVSLVFIGAIGLQSARAQDDILKDPAKHRQQIFLSLDDVLDMALQNNLDISIERLNPEIGQEEITKAESAFDSDTTFDFSYTVNESESETSPTGIGNLELGIGKRFRTGTSYRLGLQLSTTAFDGTTVAVVPDAASGNLVSLPVELQDEYSTNLQFTLVQPILRDFGTDVNRTQIRIARKNRDISLSQLRETVIEVVSQVKNAYWNLVNTQADLDATRQSLQLAYNLLKVNEAQVKVGTLAPIEVLQAKAQVASREVDVTTAELNVLNAEDRVKRLLNFAENDPVWEAALFPTDDPSQERYTIGLEESINTALTNREQLQQLRDAVTIQEISLNFSENQLLPELNAIGAFNLNGTDRNFGDALNDFSDINEFNAVFGAEFSYPLGNRAAKSDVNSARLQLDRTRLSQRNLEQLIAVEVRVAHRNVKTAYELIGSTRVARELAEEQLEAEQQKFNEGLSTNFQVLDYQDKLTQTRTRESQAMTSYNQSLVNLDKAIGMTLQRHNILLAE